jgi:hypothetical protein
MVRVMPYWWTTDQCRKQFPAGTSTACTIDIDYLQQKYEPDNSIHYCPDWAAPRKKGRATKEDLRAKSPLEIAMETSKGVEKKRRTVASEHDLSGKEGNYDGAVGAV